MPQKKRTGRGKEKRIKIAGPWNTKFSMPVGRIPIKIGSDSRLSSTGSRYPEINLDAPITAVAITTAAGAVSVSQGISLGLIKNWPTRFQSLFDEYVITGYRLEISLGGSTATAPAVASGYMALTVDENAAGAPSNTCLDQSKIEVDLSTFSADRRYLMTWKANDYGDLTFRPTGTSYTPIYIKAFASVVDTFTVASQVSQVIVMGTLALRFRGYQQT
jgi:hypothetical protein